MLKISHPPALDRVDTAPRGRVEGRAVLAPGPDRPLGRGRLKLALRSIRPGPVVVTAYDNGPIGFTCESFSGLSVRPPLVAFAPRRTSLSWPQIKRVGRFCVNVPTADNAHLLGRFAQLGTDRFAGQGWTTTPLGSPVLGGTGWWLECRLWAEHDGGDHHMVLAEVRDLGSDVTLLDPLVFTGSYPDD